MVERTDNTNSKELQTLLSAMEGRLNKRIDHLMPEYMKTIKLHLNFMSQKIDEKADSHERTTKAHVEGINRNFLILGVAISLAMAIVVFYNNTTVDKQTEKPAKVCTEVYTHKDNTLRCLRWEGENYKLNVESETVFLSK